jgi:hypothetical protein
MTRRLRRVASTAFTKLGVSQALMDVRSTTSRANVNQTGPVPVREASTRERPDGLRRGMFVVGAPLVDHHQATGSEKEN